MPAPAYHTQYGLLPCLAVRSSLLKTIWDNDSRCTVSDVQQASSRAYQKIRGNVLGVHHRYPCGSALMLYIVAERVVVRRRREVGNDTLG